MALRSVGDTFNMQGDHRKALEYYQRSLDVANQTEDQLLIARSTLNMASLTGN